MIHRSDKYGGRPDTMKIKQPTISGGLFFSSAIGKSFSATGYLVFETGLHGRVRRFRRFDIQHAESVFVLLDEVIQQKGQSLRRMGAENDPIRQLDGDLLLSAMPGLIHTKHQDDLLTGAHGIAYVCVRTFHIGVIPF
jgi:hypothetical protein